ncbi:hypothetical protein Vadar_008830 [Vaccinium darrowii]|uniref:Uncharacterized protein n=1 Tax=Vaccinium darrowii TaxID=229202 RepID=A0ACB7X8M9_9ERIC|nr:hypothetical protein Vadar_008830 [Vaccinium darrowii]
MRPIAISAAPTINQSTEDASLEISRNMRQIAVAVVTVLLVAVQIPYPSSVPAFLWSPHEDGYSRGTSGAKPVDSSVVGFLKGRSHSESQMLSELITSMEQSGSGARYTVLYVSDPLRPAQYPSYREVEYFLQTMPQEMNQSIPLLVMQFAPKIITFGGNLSGDCSAYNSNIWPLLYSGF